MFGAVVVSRAFTSAKFKASELSAIFEGFGFPNCRACLRFREVKVLFGLRVQGFGSFWLVQCLGSLGILSRSFSGGSFLWKN